MKFFIVAEHHPYGICYTIKNLRGKVFFESTQLRNAKLELRKLNKDHYDSKIAKIKEWRRIHCAPKIKVEVVHTSLKQCRQNLEGVEL